MSQGVIMGPLPDFGSLVGRYAKNGEKVWLRSDELQIIHSATGSAYGPEERCHAHGHSLECHIILDGLARLEIDGCEITIETNCFICISHGVFHRTLELSPACKILTIRAPSVDDKVYQ